MVALPYTSSSEAYPKTRFEPLPIGSYEAVVVQSELCPTKAGNGQFVKLMWQITEPGQWCNRTLFSQHNVLNPNPDAEMIGRRELQDFATAMGVPEFAETDSLHGKPVVIKVAIELDKNGKFPPKNVITGAIDPNEETSANNQRLVGTMQAGQGRGGATTAQSRASSMSPTHASTGRASVGNIPNGMKADVARAVAAAGVNGGPPNTKRAAAPAANTRDNPFAE